MSGLEGWISTAQAAALTGYSEDHVRGMARKGQIEARKIGRDWLVRREAVLEHKRRMDRLGPNKHNPWRQQRQDLEKEGRGR